MNGQRKEAAQNDGGIKKEANQPVQRYNDELKGERRIKDLNSVISIHKSEIVGLVETKIKMRNFLRKIRN